MEHDVSEIRALVGPEGPARVFVKIDGGTWRTRAVPLGASALQLLRFALASNEYLSWEVGTPPERPAEFRCSERQIAQRAAAGLSRGGAGNKE